MKIPDYEQLMLPMLELAESGISVSLAATETLMARKLRQKNSGAQQIYQKVTSAEAQLKKSLNEIVTAHDVETNPIKGSCKYCQNENFWNKEKNSSDKKELEQIPQIVFLKQ